MQEISVIVPVYNAEAYLHRCIDSILAQTFTDFELILVDDGSTDSSGAICDKYAQNNNRIKVVHKENGGVSSARNVGLNHANGEYVAFVDSDDYVSNVYLEKLISKEYDLSICGCYNVDKEKNIMGVSRQEKNSIETVDPHNILKWYEHGSLYSVWTSIFKRSIIKKYKIFFDENTTRGEDTIFMFQYVELCKKVRFIEDILYYYVRSDDGTLTTTLTLKNVYALGYLDRFLSDWMKRNKVHSDKFESPAYWTKYEQKIYFLQIYNDSDMSVREKYSWYKAFFATDNFCNYINVFFKGYSWKFRFLLNLRNPIILCIYEEYDRRIRGRR